MKHVRRMIGALAVATAVLASAACGSADGTGSTSDVANAAATGPAVAQLRTKIDARLKPPTGIGLDTSLSRKPDAGKFIVSLLTPLAVAKTESAAQAAAARMLGWRYQEIQQGTGPEDAAKALDAAIALRPAGIIYYGTPRQSLEAGLREAQAAGIPVVATAQVDPLAAPIIASNSNSGGQLATLGVGLADYVAANSGLTAQVALVTVPAYPVLASFTNGFTHELAGVCPHCRTTALPQQLSDIGTVTPTSVVNALRRDPGIKYVIFDNGSTSIGVEDAIQAAGLEDVVVGGEAPSAQSIGQLKGGSDQIWAALSIPILGYGLIDTFARHFNGDSLDPVFKENPAWQILTKDNVGSAVLDGQGNYVGYAAYPTAFAKLWRLG
jgi:ribose transport system substrate-binding protein